VTEGKLKKRIFSESLVNLDYPSNKTLEIREWILNDILDEAKKEFPYPTGDVTLYWLWFEKWFGSSP
jgi:hypothetical protein